jgi:multidrug efflux pump
MTTFAMVLGVIPLITSTGAGAKARFSMGLVIFTGMAIGTIFTLFVVPMFYTFISSRTRARLDDATRAVAAGAAQPVQVKRERSRQRSDAPLSRSPIERTTIRAQKSMR